MASDKPGAVQRLRSNCAKRVFFDLDNARAKFTTWVAVFKTVRQHLALGYLTPAAYAAKFTATDDRLRNPHQLHRLTVVPPAPMA
jgi:putative transposase